MASAPGVAPGALHDPVTASRQHPSLVALLAAEQLTLALERAGRAVRIGERTAGGDLLGACDASREHAWLPGRTTPRVPSRVGSNDSSTR